MSLNEFVLGCLVISPCIFTVWHLWNYKETKKKDKKKASLKIKSVIDRRKWFLEKEKKEKEQIKKEIEMSLIYKNLSPAEIKAEIKAEECFRKYVSLGNLSVGCADDYFDFLDSYFEHGGIATHHYENNIEKNLKESQEIYIARNEIEIFPSYGSSGKIIIVMPGCKVIHGNEFGNNFYCYDDILNQKYAFWIPTFKDWAERFEKCI